MKDVLITIFLFILITLGFGKEYLLRQELRGYKIFVHSQIQCLLDVDKNGVPNFDAYCASQNWEAKELKFSIVTSTPRK